MLTLSQIQALDRSARLRRIGELLAVAIMRKAAAEATSKTTAPKPPLRHASSP